MNILITGINGFVGSHLVEYIIRERADVEIFGIKKPGSDIPNLANLKDKIRIFECDIKNADDVLAIVNKIKPIKIFHLAAQSIIPASWDSPAGTFETNILGQCNIFEAVKRLQNNTYRPVIQIAGSSEEYGLVKPDEIPIKETNPLRPLSPYAVSKVAQDYMGYQYYKSHDLQIVRTRAFNHSGPRRSDVFVDSSFAKQIVEIEKGIKKPIIEVGNLEVSRDFTDVRDIVRAYWLATEKCEPGEVYNICSGKDNKISDVLDTLINLSTVDNIEIRIDPDRIRPVNVPVLRGDYSKFKKATGWQPKIDYLKKTLKDTLNYWRNNITAN